MTAFASPVERDNYRHLVMDIAWFAIALAATSRFMQFYAIRMGAGAFELGMLTALPSMMLVFSTTFSQWWRSRNPDSVKAVWYPGIGHRLIFLLPAFAPFFPDHLRVVWLIVAAVLPAMAQGVASAVFMVMMRETVNQNNITPLLARRQLTLNIMLMLGAVGFGLLLEWIPYPYNYQIMFVLAFGFSMLSQWHLGKLNLLHASDKPKKSKNRPLKELFASSHFQSVALISVVSYVAFFSVFAIVPLHLEQNLGATEGYMAIYGVAELIAGSIMTLFLKNILQRFGSRGGVSLGLAGTAVAAFANALAPNLNFALIGAVLTGASWALVGIAVLSFFTERTEPDDMQASTIYHQLIFTAMFIGPLIGSGIAGFHFSLVTVLLVGAALRLLGAVVTHFGMAIFTGKRVDPIQSSPLSS